MFPSALLFFFCFVKLQNRSLALLCVCFPFLFLFLAKKLENTLNVQDVLIYGCIVLKFNKNAAAKKIKNKIMHNNHKGKTSR